MSTFEMSAVAKQLFESRINKTDSEVFLERLELTTDFNRFEFALDTLNEGLGDTLKRFVIATGVGAGTAVLSTAALASLGLVVPVVGGILALTGTVLGVILGLKAGAATFSAMKPSVQKYSKQLGKVTRKRDAYLEKMMDLTNKENKGDKDEKTINSIVTQINKLSLEQIKTATALHNEIANERMKGNISNEEFSRISDLTSIAMRGNLTFMGLSLPKQANESIDVEDGDMLIESINTENADDQLDESMVLAALAFAGIMGAGASILGALSNAKINQSLKPMVEEFESRYLRDAKIELAMASKTVKLIKSIDDYNKHEATLESVKTKLQVARKEIDKFLQGNLIDFQNKSEPGMLGKAFQNSTEKKAKAYFEKLLSDSIKNVEGMIKDIERKRDLMLSAD